MNNVKFEEVSAGFFFYLVWKLTGSDRMGNVVMSGWHERKKCWRFFADLKKKMEITYWFITYWYGLNLLIFL